MHSRQHNHSRDMANVCRSKRLTPTRTFVGSEPIYPSTPGVMDAQRRVGSFRASHFTVRVYIFLPILCYPILIFIQCFVPPLSTLRIKLKPHLNSLPLLLALSLHRFMFKFIGRHQFPEQSWQVSSSLLCKSCITRTGRCISRHPVPTLFLIRTHTVTTHTHC